MPAPTPLDRFLRLFTDVRPGEGRTGVVMFANVFLILCAYYFIKPLREGWLAITDIDRTFALLLGPFGAGDVHVSKLELKAYTSFAQGLLLIPTVMLYARLSDRLDRVRLVAFATLFMMGNLVVFWALQPGLLFENLLGSGVLFYLWVGIFSVFVVAQFFAFAADLYRGRRGHRLMPFVALGATAGAWAGSSLARQLVAREVVAPGTLMLVALGPLAASIVLTWAAAALGPGGGEEADRAEGEEPEDEEPQPDPPEGVKVRGAFSIIAASRYLLAAAAVTLLVNWVNTNGENLLYGVVQKHLEREVATLGLTDPAAVRDYIQRGTTVFYGDFFSWVNLLAFGLQAFAASRLLKYGGFGAILLLLPVVALGSYSAMALVPVLAVVKATKILENATDYSVNNTARHVLWLPLRAEEKYKAKPTIDSLFARLGDGLAAMTVLVGARVLLLADQAYFALNIGLVLIWLVVGVYLVREHRRLLEARTAGGATGAEVVHAG